MWFSKTNSSWQDSQLVVNFISCKIVLSNIQPIWNSPILVIKIVSFKYYHTEHIKMYYKDQLDYFCVIYSNSAIETRGSSWRLRNHRLRFWLVSSKPILTVLQMRLFLPLSMFLFIAEAYLELCQISKDEKATPEILDRVLNTLMYR